MHPPILTPTVCVARSPRWLSLASDNRERSDHRFEKKEDIANGNIANFILKRRLISRIS